MHKRKLLGTQFWMLAKAFCLLRSHRSTFHLHLHHQTSIKMTPKKHQAQVKTYAFPPVLLFSICRPWSSHSCPLHGWVCFHNRLCQHQLDQSYRLLLKSSSYLIKNDTVGNGVLRLKTIFSLKFSAAFDLRPAACTMLAARLWSIENMRALFLSFARGLVV